MKISAYKILFVLVVFFFLITRLYRIADLPSSVYWDEASIGYNAFSIATDLKDEWGSFLPVHFRAFGEFKLPVYIYSVVPFVKVLGLNAFSVRIPAVIYSLGTLLLTYLLVSKITGKKWPGVLSGFILSVSPWFFIFSRTGYEATAGVFFLLLSVYLFLCNSKKLIIFFLGTVSIILSMYSYTSFRLISPLVFAMFLIRVIKLYFVNKSIKRNIYIPVLSLIIFLLSLIPIARLFLFDAGFGRAQTFALIPGFQQVYDLSGKPHLQITYNRSGHVDWKENISTIGANYLSHFSPNFLLWKGDANPRSQIPGHGQLYWIDIPLFILGIYAIYKKRSFIFLIPLLLLLLAPIPASLTRESPHALRSILAAPAFAMITSIGVWYIAEKINIKKFSVIFIAVISIIYYLSFELYAMDFVLKYQNLTLHDWQYDYKEIFMDKKESGVITDKYGQPYIFALYYLKYPPEKFRNEVKYNPVDKWGFSLVSSFDGFQFK